MKSERLEGYIHLCRKPDGSIAYYEYRRAVRIFENGKRKDMQVRLGKNLAKAQARARELDAEGDAVEKGEKLLLNAPLGEYAEWYFSYVEKEVKLLGWKTIRGNVRVFVQHVGPAVPIGSITSATIKGFLDMRKVKVEKATVYGSLKDVRRMFNVAIEKGHLKENPCRGFAVENGLDKDLRLPTKEEVHRLMEHLEANHPEMHRVLLALIFTGGRVSEIMSLDWIRVDCMNIPGRLRLTRRKRGYEHALPIAEPLRRSLESLWQAGNMPLRGLVYPNPKTGRLDTARQFLRRFKRVLKRLDLEWLTVKVFRNYAGTLVQGATGNIRDAQMLLGHKNARMTEVYLRGDKNAAKDRAIKALEEAF